MKYKLWWISADRQASIFCGEYQTVDAALANWPMQRAGLLDQCADAGERDNIMAGNYSIEMK